MSPMLVIFMLLWLNTWQINVRIEIDRGSQFQGVPSIMAGKTLLSSSRHRSRNTVAKFVHIMAKQKSESTMGSCQADIHPDPPTGYPQLSSARPRFLHDPQPAETAPSAREQVLKAWACEGRFRFNPYHCPVGSPPLWAPGAPELRPSWLWSYYWWTVLHMPHALPMWGSGGGGHSAGTFLCVLPLGSYDKVWGFRSCFPRDDI